MGYIDQNLISGEQVAYRSGLHWIVLIRAITVAAVLGLFGLLMLYLGGPARRLLPPGGSVPQPPGTASSDGLATAFLAIGVVALVIAAIYLLAAIVRRRSAEFAVTNKRIIFKTGVARRTTQEIFLNKVESVNVGEGLLGRTLNYGSIAIRGTGGSIEPFHKIAHAQEFRRQVQEQISRNP